MLLKNETWSQIRPQKAVKQKKSAYRTGKKLSR